MKWFREHWTLFSLIILVASAGWMIFLPPLPGSTTGGRVPAPQEGFLAPDFTLPDSQGQSIRLSDLRGKPVLLNLWASWCPPCREEMPAMQKAYDRYAARGFTILAMNTTYQDQKTDALNFVAERKLTFPILFDMDGKVAQAYLVRAMPTSFFIDSQGVIQKVVIGGPMSEGLLFVEIEKLMKGTR
jgi:peroxiredoxin